ncbi:transposase [Cerasicoccus frondis]|uniref:transposase n=1 Tax=Cerasicoccus frondis TaxID=490090 RepID=UPI00285249C5|nr:transposase [Cerasicoccus frondis]
MPQSFAANYVHVVFSTKHRYAYMADETLRKCMWAGLAEISGRLECPAEIVGGHADHVHILARVHRTVALSDWIKELKRVSSVWAKQLQAMERSFAWQNGYAAFSVSVSNLVAVRQYILNQEEHHQKISFQDEYRAILQKHGVDWDERYVWD